MFIQLITLLTLCTIWIQDSKERMVYVILFPVLSICLLFLHFQNRNLNQIVIATLKNVGVIISILTILYAYVKIKMKKAFLKEAFGLGDVAILFSLTVGFPFFTFILLISLGFITVSLIQIFKLNNSKITIPFAGELSLFFALIFVVTWWFTDYNLYLL